MCWWTQYDARPDTIRCCHHVVARMSRRHDHDVFQSSRMSWSSKIIAVGSVESSHRMTGSDQVSR